MRSQVFWFIYGDTEDGITANQLRNQGLVSKVSEIDSVRQFTTRYTLAEAVDRLALGGEKA